MGNYVDDGCLSGNERMQGMTEKAPNPFHSKPSGWDNFEFFGTQISTLGPSSFSIGQESYT